MNSRLVFLFQMVNKHSFELSLSLSLSIFVSLSLSPHFKEIVHITHRLIVSIYAFCLYFTQGKLTYFIYIYIYIAQGSHEQTAPQHFIYSACMTPELCMIYFVLNVASAPLLSFCFMTLLWAQSFSGKHFEMVSQSYSVMRDLLPEHLVPLQ